MFNVKSDVTKSEVVPIDQFDGQGGLMLKNIRTRRDSLDSVKSHSISNSSLQDNDEQEYTGKELATFMEQVNNTSS